MQMQFLYKHINFSCAINRHSFIITINIYCDNLFCMSHKTGNRFRIKLILQ